MLVDDVNSLPILMDQMDIQPSLEYGRTEIKDGPSYILQDEIPQYCILCNILLIPELREITGGILLGWKCSQCDCRY